MISRSRGVIWMGWSLSAVRWKRGRRVNILSFYHDRMCEFSTGVNKRGLFVRLCGYDLPKFIIDLDSTVCHKREDHEDACAHKSFWLSDSSVLARCQYKFA